MEIKRILSNDLSMLTARSNEGKTMVLINIIKEYQEQYGGDVWVYGMDEEITKKLKVKVFTSLEELEEIKSSIVIIDEIGKLFDLDNRKKKMQIDNTLRMVNHHGNKILMTGLPTDFKKYLCGKIKCFLFKTLKISDLINGCDAKERLNQCGDKRKGAFLLQIPKGEVLCCDNSVSGGKTGNWWTDKVELLHEYDTKAKNVDLFVQKKCKKSAENVPKANKIKKGVKFP